MRQNIPGTSPYEPVIGFSRAVRAGQTVYVSGTGPVGADLADATTQTRHVLEIIRGSLEKAGARMEDVVRTRMYITHVEDWEAIGKAHGEFFGTIRPAATMVVVAGLLQPTWRVEIEAEAMVHSAPHE
jgi:enamine deaminase RidA (YjgF/YER057c/UK114 family)